MGNNWGSGRDPSHPLADAEAFGWALAQRLSESHIDYRDAEPWTVVLSQDAGGEKLQRKIFDARSNQERTLFLEGAQADKWLNHRIPLHADCAVLNGL